MVGALPRGQPHREQSRAVLLLHPTPSHASLSNPTQKQGLHPGLSGHWPSVILRALCACPWRSAQPPPALTTLSASVKDQTLLCVTRGCLDKDGKKSSALTGTPNLRAQRRRSHSTRDGVRWEAGSDSAGSGVRSGRERTTLWKERALPTVPGGGEAAGLPQTRRAQGVK